MPAVELFVDMGVVVGGVPVGMLVDVVVVVVATNAVADDASDMFKLSLNIIQNSPVLANSPPLPTYNVGTPFQLAT